MQDFIQKFTNKKIRFVQIANDFFQTNDNLEKVEKQIGLEPSFKGLFLGSYDENSVFQPSCALLEWIAKSSKTKVFLDKKTEWLFVCKRDVFGQGILKSNIDDSKFKNKMVLVQNEKDENIGLGKVIDSFSKQNSVVIECLVDKGTFLRRER